MKSTVKLSEEEHKWLTKFDDNFHVALVKIKSGCTSHNDLKKEHKQILTEIETTKTELKEEISNLKQGY